MSLHTPKKPMPARLKPARLKKEKTANLGEWFAALLAAAAVCALAVSCSPAAAVAQLETVELQTAYDETEPVDWDKIWTIVREDNEAYLKHLSEQDCGR